MFYEFDTIKHIKNFEKYDVWYGRTYYVIFKKKYGTVLFGTVWYCLVLICSNFSKIRANHCIILCYPFFIYLKCLFILFKSTLFKLIMQTYFKVRPHDSYSFIKLI